MFLYDRPFDFNYLTYDISFVDRPSYNPKKDLLIHVFYAFWDDIWMDT